MQIKGLSLQGKTTWDNVFQKWLKGEGSYESWQQIAKGKGWESWEEWRTTWVNNFIVHKRQWFRYVINDPVNVVPHFRVGPTQSWQNHFLQEERNMHTFLTLIDRIPSYKKNKKALSFLEEFPSPTELIGIYMPDKSIVALEGHHRATALSIALKQGRVLNFKELPTIALASLENGEEALLDIALNKGSAKNISSC